MPKEKCFVQTCLGGPGGPSAACGDPFHYCAPGNDGIYYTVGTVPCDECVSLFGGKKWFGIPLDGICLSVCHFEGSGPKTPIGQTAPVGNTGTTDYLTPVGTLGGLLPAASADDARKRAGIILLIILLIIISVFIFLK